MNLMKMLAATLLLIPVCGSSQEQKNELVYFVGKELKQTLLTETATFKLPLSELVVAPYLQVSYREADYAVDGYTIAILSKKSGEVLGPFKNQQGSLVENAARMKHKFSPGDRIFIEEVIAYCGKCKVDKNIIAKGLTILVE